MTDSVLAPPLADLPIGGRVASELARRWDTFGVDSEPPARTVIVGVDRSSDAKVASLLFAESGALVAVAKIARSAIAQHALATEHRVLQDINGIASEQLRRGIPRPLALLSVEGQQALVLTPITGRPMTVDYYSPGHVSRESDVANDFRAANMWLALMQSETAGEVVRVQEAVQRWLLPTLDAYVRTVGASSAELELFRAALDRARSRSGKPLLTSAVHGDYWMGNLMREEPRQVAGVVDWELGSSRGFPMLDVFKFPTSYGLYLDRAKPWRDGRVRGHPGREDAPRRWRRYGESPNLPGFGHAYFGEGWLPDLVRSFVQSRACDLRLPNALLGPFFVGFLAAQALAANTPEFRQGYRSMMTAFATEREACWVWAEKDS